MIRVALGSSYVVFVGLGLFLQLSERKTCELVVSRHIGTQCMVGPLWDREYDSGAHREGSSFSRLSSFRGRHDKVRYEASAGIGLIEMKDCSFGAQVSPRDEERIDSQSVVGSGPMSFPVSVVLHSCTSSTREIIDCCLKVASEDRADSSPVWALTALRGLGIRFFCFSASRFYQAEIANNLAQINAVPPRRPKAYHHRRTEPESKETRTTTKMI